MSVFETVTLNKALFAIDVFNLSVVVSYQRTSTTCEQISGAPFVLIDGLGYNYGRLTGGIDWFCRDDSGPLEERQATVRSEKRKLYSR